MNIRIILVIILLLTGCHQQTEEGSAQPSLLNIAPILSAEEAKSVFERIDPSLNFTLSSNKYFGITDYLYYADLMRPTSQVTINIGKRKNKKKPFTNLYINISALKTINESMLNEISELAEQYIKGFIISSFQNGEEISNQIVLPLSSSLINRRIDMETDNFYIECSISEGKGNPEYLSYLLRITENTFQEELNQRIIEQKMP